MPKNDGKAGKAYPDMDGATEIWAHIKGACSTRTCPRICRMCRACAGTIRIAPGCARGPPSPPRGHSLSSNFERGHPPTTTVVNISKSQPWCTAHNSVVAVVVGRRLGWSGSRHCAASACAAATPTILDNVQPRRPNVAVTRIVVRFTGGRRSGCSVPWYMKRQEAPSPSVVDIFQVAATAHRPTTATVIVHRWGGTVLVPPALSSHKSATHTHMPHTHTTSTLITTM